MSDLRYPHLRWDEDDPYNSEIIRERIPLWKRLLLGVGDLFASIFKGILHLFVWWL